jgi:hypothetical protein
MAITAKQAIEAARGSKGFVTTIARQLGCDRTHVYRLMDKFPTVKQAVKDERESLKDFAEGKLFQQIDDGNTTAIIFYLKCQAKERGYVERQEVMAANLNIDLSTLTDEQLERIRNGEDPAVVATTG